jgi:EmrB/QacA subfamily drug resistance transporter
MVIFSLGSLLCALAPTLSSLTGMPAIDWLIGSRAFQAIGAASLNPVSLAIIMGVFPPERRGAAIGIWGALSGIAAAAGPVLGGFLVQQFDWRWIFFVNLPFCLIGLVLLALFVPETREKGVSRRIDVPGVITLSAAMFCLALAIIEGNDWGWNSTTILSLFGGALVALILFIVVEFRVKEPIVDFRLFKIGSFTASSVATFMFGMAIQGAFLILVLYFVYVLGFDQLHAAYAIIPIPAASFVVSAFSGTFSRKIKPRISGTLGMALLAIGFFLLFTLDLNAGVLDTTWRGLIIGAGMGMCFQSFPNIALSEVPRAKLGVSSGIFNTFRQLGFVLGVAILISLFVGQVQVNIPQASSKAIQIVQQDTSIPAQFHPFIIKGLQQASANNSSSNFQTQSVDLTKFANDAPPQYRAQVKAHLQALGDKISAQFKQALLQSFETTWLTAAFGYAAQYVLRLQ